MRQLSFYNMTGDSNMDVTFHVLGRTENGCLVCTVPCVAAWFHITDRELDSIYQILNGNMKFVTYTKDYFESNSNYLLAENCKSQTGIFSIWSTGIERLTPQAIYRNPVVSVISFCNLRCKYCYMGTPSINKNVRKHLPKDIIISFIEEVIRKGKGETQSIQFFGGEPLLHPDLPTLIEHSLNKGLYVRVSTNGTASKIRSEKFAPYVKNRRVEWRISMDSHIVSTHEKYRGKGTYKNILNNMEYLADNHSNVSLKTVLHKSNIGEFEGYLEFANRYGFNVAYGLMAYMGEAVVNNVKRDITSKEVVEKILEIYTRKPHLINLLGPSPFGRMIRSLYVKNTSAFPRFFFYLHSDRHVYPMDELVNPHFIIGRDANFNSKTLEVMQEELYIKKGVCLKCPIEPFCYRGSYGSLYGKDPTLNSEFDSCQDKRETYKLLMELGEKGMDIAGRIFGQKNL